MCLERWSEDAFSLERSMHKEETMAISPDPERERILDEQARRMEEEGGPPLDHGVPVRDKKEDEEEDLELRKEAAGRDQQEGRD